MRAFNRQFAELNPDREIITRDGLPVKLLTLHGDDNMFPVEGYVLFPHGQQEYFRWTATGKVKRGEGNSVFNLIFADSRTHPITRINPNGAGRRKIDPNLKRITLTASVYESTLNKLFALANAENTNTGRILDKIIETYDRKNKVSR